MNTKDKFGCQNNNQRTSFTKEFKRKILIEFSKGRSARDIFEEATLNILKINTNDKKYCAKLIHKWKKELYINNKILAFTSIKPTDENLDYEINNIVFDFEKDDIEEEYATKKESV